MAQDIEKSPIGEAFKALNRIRKVASEHGCLDEVTRLRVVTRFQQLTVGEIIEELRRFFEEL